MPHKGSMFNLVFDPGFTLKNCNASDRGSMFNLVVIQYYTDHASVLKFNTSVLELHYVADI